MRVTLKLATSLDGRIATASGESRWITGEQAREEVHLLRLVHGNVLVGVETVVADDPELTVRIPGKLTGQPRRIVLDSRQRIPQVSKLVATAHALRTVVVSILPASDRLTEAGVDVITVDPDDGRVSPKAAVAALAARGVQALLIEGGGQVAASFLAEGLVDALEWFRAPIILGDEGRPAVGAFVLKDLASAPRFRRVGLHELGDDVWERFERI